MSNLICLCAGGVGKTTVLDAVAERFEDFGMLRVEVAREGVRNICNRLYVTPGDFHGDDFARHFFQGMVFWEQVRQEVYRSRWADVALSDRSAILDVPAYTPGLTPEVRDKLLAFAPKPRKAFLFIAGQHCWEWRQVADKVRFSFPSAEAYLAHAAHIEDAIRRGAARWGVPLVEVTTTDLEERVALVAAEVNAALKEVAE